MLFPIQETLKAIRIFCGKHLTSAGNRITFEDVNQSVLFTAAWNVRNSTYENFLYSDQFSKILQGSGSEFV